MNDDPEEKTGESDVIEGGQIGPVIEGGQIGTFEDLPYDPVRHRDDTARSLAYVLVAVLSFTVFAHYGTNIWLRVTGHEQVAEGISKIFDVWLPIISSLASG